MFVSLIFTTMHRWLWFGIHYLRNLPLLHPGVDFPATKMASQCWHLFLKLAFWGVQRWDAERFGKIRQSWQSLAWWVNTLDSNMLLPNFVMFSFAVDFVLHRSERVLPYTPTAFDSGVSCPYSKRSHWDEAVQDPHKLPEGVNKLTDFKVCSYLAIARLAMLQPGATWTNCICCELLQCALESGWISSWWKGWWISS